MATLTSPFIYPELHGWFEWNDELTTRLSNYSKRQSWFYHACHYPQLRAFTQARKLFMRSTFESRARGALHTDACVWGSLNAWHSTHGHNHHGPHTIKLPLDHLDGRRFYVYRRRLSGWDRYYFVQRRTRSRLFRSSAMAIDPIQMFEKSKSSLVHQERTQYELVLTQSVPLDGRHIIRSTEHKRCAARSCKGRSKSESQDEVEMLIERELHRMSDVYPQHKEMILAGIQEPA